MIFAIIEQGALYAPLILGAYLSLVLMKIPNLAIESAYIFGAIMAAKVTLLTNGPSVPALLAAICAAGTGGMLVGLLAALLAERLAISPLLAAIITTGIFHGVALFVLGGTHCSLPGTHSSLRLVPCVAGYPDLCGIACIAGITIMMFIVFMKTKLGVSCALYGDNRTFLRHYRISTSYVVAAGLAASNALSGISGYLIAQSNSFVDTGMGAGLPLICLTALILGRSLMRTRAIITSIPPLCGLFFYFVLQHALLNTGFDLRYFMAVQALIVVVTLVGITRFGSSSYREIIDL